MGECWQLRKSFRDGLWAVLTLKLAFLCAVLLLALALARYITRQPEAEFDVRWYARVGAVESIFGVALLFLASWIAVITPAAHETGRLLAAAIPPLLGRHMGLQGAGVEPDLVARRVWRRASPCRSACTVFPEGGAAS